MRSCAALWRYVSLNVSLADQFTFRHTVRSSATDCSFEDVYMKGQGTAPKDPNATLESLNYL
jgi:hypothetical protein